MDFDFSNILHNYTRVAICASPKDSLTELAQMLDFWFQFRLNISLMLHCGFNFVKKYHRCHVVVQFLQKTFHCCHVSGQNIA